MASTITWNSGICTDSEYLKNTLSIGRMDNNSRVGIRASFVLIRCRETKVISLANPIGGRQYTDEPIKTDADNTLMNQSKLDADNTLMNQSKLTRSAGKRVRAGQDNKFWLGSLTRDNKMVHFLKAIIQ